jgi:hypothetical protein
MDMSFSEILLWLYVVNLGTTFGAGLFETRIILPQWFTKSPETGFQVNRKSMNETDTGRKFWGFVTTVPLTLLTIANLVLAIQSSEPRHTWWLASVLIILVERLETFFFFIPTAIKLMNAETLSPSRMNTLVTLWIRFNYIRNLLTLFGWLAAMKVLSLG